MPNQNEQEKAAYNKDGLVACFGFDCRPSPNGCCDGGKTHGDIESHAFASFGDVVPEQALAVDHAEKREVGDWELNHAEHTRWDGQQDIVFTAPDE